MNIKIWVGAGLIIGLSACAHREVASVTPSEKAQTTPKKISRIIDAHVHLEELEANAKGPAGYREFLENHIVGLVAHASRANPVPALSKGPLPVIRCAGLSLKVTPAQVEAGLKDGRVKCLKVYLGYVERYAYDPFYKPFYKLAEKYDVPVVFHTGDTLDKNVRVKFADPLTIDEIAVTYRKVKFVLAHLGNPWFHSAAEVIYKNDNVYADLSALMIGDLSKSSPEAVEELVVKQVRWVYLFVENPTKLMFGTDWPLVNISSYVAAIQKAIPEEHWDDVFFKNAERVFKFGPDSSQRIAGDGTR